MPIGLGDVKQRPSYNRDITKCIFYFYNNDTYLELVLLPDAGLTIILFRADDHFPDDALP